MDNNGKFWCFVWSILLIGIVMLASVITIDDIATMHAINNMVDKGASPQDAACAIRQSTDNCILAGPK